MQRTRPSPLERDNLVDRYSGELDEASGRADLERMVERVASVAAPPAP